MPHSCSILQLADNSELKFNYFSVQGMKIVGATCSTERGAEYVFQDGLIDPSTNTIVYNCLCKGMSSLFTYGANKMVCVIHYWVCPFTS